MHSKRYLLPLAVIAALCAPPSASRAQNEASAPRASTDQPTVVLTVTVTDKKGRFVNGLAREDFAVFEDSAEREVVALSAERVPASVGVVFDMSGSITYSSGNEVDAARRAVLELAKHGDKADEYFIMGFNNGTHLLTDWTHDSLAVADGLNALPALQGKGAMRTALYDAMYEGLSKVKEGANPKRVLLVVTDGQDNISRHKFEEVRRLAAAGGTLVYVLGIYSHETMGYGPSEVPMRKLEELCRATGGQSFAVESVRPMLKSPGTKAALAEIKTALETIALELRSQYSLSFRPSPPAARKGEWRRVAVKVRQPRRPDKTYPARAREGYVSGVDAP
ncbi:MAG: Ca-activated chloride channel [Acidobacteriota bacterium]|jgi:Ca-activated chloride channel family protein|nr:Ca-activated chloride channel [Acidobacteriota bacterium]